MVAWLRAIADEIRTCFRLTLEPIKQGKRSDPGWLRDRHLRRGFIFAVPFFLAGILMASALVKANSTAQWTVEFGVALASNLFWLSYAAWSRQRSNDGH